MMNSAGNSDTIVLAFLHNDEAYLLRLIFKHDIWSISMAIVAMQMGSHSPRHVNYISSTLHVLM